jgi:hypothetical protein
MSYLSHVRHTDGVVLARAEDIKIMKVSLRTSEQEQTHTSSTEAAIAQQRNNEARASHFVLLDPAPLARLLATSLGRGSLNEQKLHPLC